MIRSQESLADGDPLLATLNKFSGFTRSKNRLLRNRIHRPFHSRSLERVRACGLTNSVEAEASPDPTAIPFAVSPPRNTKFPELR